VLEAATLCARGGDPNCGLDSETFHIWQVTFYAKGADSVMQQRIGHSEWMEEEVANLAREGLRTLVLACRPLSPSQLAQFQVAMGSARLGQRGAPANAVAAVWDELQSQEEMRLLAVTAVEDTLQTNVRAIVGIAMTGAAD
jgi:phospholipid-translocating ATPase